MELVSLSPLPAGSLLWQPRPGAWMLGFACKATFTLRPGQSPLAPEQEPLHHADRHWSDDPAWSLYAPADLVPIRPRADVVLVGEAFAPGAQPVRSLITRLLVSDIDKAIEIHGDRWFMQDGSLQEGASFTRIPLLWERAAGGPDTVNPVGVRVDDRDRYGRRRLPHLQPPGTHVVSPDDVIETIGYGPVAPTWPSRRQRLGRHAAAWSDRDWNRQPLPTDLDAAYFNAAPQDQQTQQLRGDERLVLDNLHPEHPHLVTNLAGHPPRAFIERSGKLPQSLPLRADLLWIDTARGLCTLTWRGQIPLDHPQEQGRVLISLEEPGRSLTWSDVKRLAGEGRPDAEAAPSSQNQNAVRPRGPATPAERREDSAVMNRIGTMPAPPELDLEGAILPFVGGSPDSSSAPISAPPATGGSRAQRLSGTPFAAAAPSPSSQPLVAFPAAAPPLAPAAPPLVASPPALVRSAPPSTIGEAAIGAAAPLGAAAAVSGGTAGALGASNAAASASDAWISRREAPAPQSRPKATPASVEPARSDAKSVVDLLWHEERAVPRIRAWWEELVTKLDFEPADPRHDLSPADPDNDRSRHNVFGVLTDGEATNSAGVARAVQGAVNDRGRFTAPLVLVAGELRFPFDELEALKATVVAATPMAGSDKKLKDSLDALNELVKLSYLQGTTSVTGRLLAQVKEQFAQSNRQLPADYLDTYVERSLLEQRRYQIRKVFGGEFIRGLLAPASDKEAPIPVYLPRSLDQKLPMVTSMRARIIVEAHPQQDQYEASLYALRAVALGRAIHIDGWPRGSFR